MLTNTGNADLKQLFLSGLVSALIAGGISVYNYNRQMELSTKYEQTKLFRELVKEFYSGNVVFRNIRTAIESCKPLYKPWGGSFGHDDINNYLGFFEDLGFLLKQGAITFEAIDHLFGAYLIEAFEYSEISKYIDDLRRGMQDRDAFREFQELARRVESNPQRERQVQGAREACKRKK